MNKTNKKTEGFFKRNKKGLLFSLGGALVLGPLALVSAPVIAAAAGAAGLLGTTATAGTVISTLAGASLTNASLAAIGNGALVVGGAGMAGGIFFIAKSVT